MARVACAITAALVAVSGALGAECPPLGPGKFKVRGN